MRQYSAEWLEKLRSRNGGKFLDAARNKFGARFDYSSVIYRSQKTPVTIICPSHAAFSQSPDKHLQSLYGCPKCGVTVRARSRIADGGERFHKAFVEQFGGRIELLSSYISVKDPIYCRCKVHNYEFVTTPDCLNNSTYACVKCGSEASGLRRRGTTVDFVERASSKFGDQFDLSQVDYKTNATKVSIRCPIHGNFEVRPVDFLKSTHGCPKCGKLHVGYAENRILRLEAGSIRPRPTKLAVMKIEVFGITAFKVGITSRSLIARYREALREVLFEASLSELDALKLERQIHATYFRERDVRIFLAGLRSGSRWSGDSEIYHEKCVPNILSDLEAAVTALVAGDVTYWSRQPKLSPPILRIRQVRKTEGQQFNKAKPVIRCDTGEVFASATAAALSIASTQGQVSMVCNGKQGHTKGVRFAYVSDYEAGRVPKFISMIKGANHRSARAVRCVDTGLIYSTITEAETANGIHRGKIALVCKGERRTAAGKRWEYLE